MVEAPQASLGGTAPANRAAERRNSPQ